MQEGIQLNVKGYLHNSSHCIKILISGGIYTILLGYVTCGLAVTYVRTIQKVKCYVCSAYTASRLVHSSFSQLRFSLYSAL
jgi:hypothetical protein